MPRFYQAPTLSAEFEQEMKKFKNLQVWQDKDILSMTQLILIEATRDTTYDISFGFKANPSQLSSFHGRIDCLLYQRYGGEDRGINDIKGMQNDDQGIGFPLVPIFFPIQETNFYAPFQHEKFSISQAISCGLWSLEHMNDIDPSIEYVRVLQTDGHRWKLYEIHRTHVKKTKFFEPRADLRQNSYKNKVVRNTQQGRFFDDYEHMLSVIGLIRYAMGIPENIVMANDTYEVEELPQQKDYQRTIQKGLLQLEKTQDGFLIDKRVFKELPVTSQKDDLQKLNSDQQNQKLLNESNEMKDIAKKGI
ncbi:UNKNOWN [Stylonychia lemnae]|uniref:Uncharacterized protein n=1 Tax=Stylonychia lemnae TaxID=5949 RepID=A0A078AJ34_STYLE|nr:UNKNOWN [Stylonychia lemnae]|eukprot:CDW81482.1 UNKNOWN [Stylonychia lemnae]